MHPPTADSLLCTSTCSIHSLSVFMPRSKSSSCDNTTASHHCVLHGMNIWPPPNFPKCWIVFSFFLIFEQDFGFGQIFCSLSSSILERKLAEVSFVAMSVSIEVQNEVLLYRSWQSLWGKVEKAWHLSAWGYWKEGNFSLHPRAGFRFCIRLWFLKTCFKEAATVVLPTGNLYCFSYTNQDVCL